MHRPQPLYLAALVTALAVRTIALDRWPGINGDEAWYGVNVQEWLHGGTPFVTTGVGNPLSPIHSGLLLAFSSLFDASAAVLRAPEALLGWLAVALAYPLLRQPLGARAAMLVTMGLAVSATAVGYARIGWDPSGTPFISVLAIGCALHNRPVLALTALGAGWLIHPTNVFLAPAVAGAWAPHGVNWLSALPATARRRVWRAGIAMVILAAPAIAWLLMRIAANPDTPLPPVRVALERLVSPVQWADRAWDALGLVSGVTTASYIAGPLPPAAARVIPAVWALVLGFAMFTGWRPLRSARHATWLLAGTAVAFAAFHVVAGPAAMQAGFERYALALFVPLVIVFAIAIDAAWPARPAAAMMAALVVGVVSAAVLAGGYFYPLAATGGEGPATYRTGAVEPKAAAFAFITADAAEAAAVAVVAEDWWLYWTLRYFAGPGGAIHVEPAPGAAIPGGVRPATEPAPAVRLAERTYVVAFAGSDWPRTLTSDAPVFTAVDPLGRPVVTVHRLIGNRQSAHSIDNRIGDDRLPIINNSPITQSPIVNSATLRNTLPTCAAGSTSCR